jgi:acyl carrier protein
MRQDECTGYDLKAAGASLRRAPLSTSQERIWFFEKLWPKSAAYSLSIPYELRGPVDVRALRRSLETLVDRHEALRTRIVEEDGNPAQLILPPGQFSVQTLTPSPAGPMTAEQVKAVLQPLVAQRMDAGGPLFQCFLWRFATEENLLLMRIHHIIADQYSVRIMIKEWSALYSGHVGAASAPLPPVKHQFADYVAWERAALRSALSARELRVLAQRLADVPPLNLPVDRTRPDRLSSNVAALTRSIGNAERSLREIARRAGVTVFVAALAGYFVTLSKWSRQTDIAVGCVVANRTHPSSLDTVGCLFNTVVVRCTPNPGLAFTEFLGQVRQSTSEALACQHIPIDAIVTELGAGGDLTRPPLYQAMFTYRQRTDLPDLPNLSVTVPRLGYVEAPTELSLELVDRPGQDTMVVCQYNTDLFDRSTIVRLVEAFSAVIRCAARNPSATLHDFDVRPTSADRPVLSTDANGEPADSRAQHVNGQPASASVSCAGSPAEQSPAERSPTEDMLVRLCRDVLKLDQVSVEDNFFALGGDSLRATRFIVRVASRLNVNLTPRAVFETSTLRELAAVVDKAQASDRACVPPLISRKR